MSERKTFFADILLPVPIHQVFTYRIPFELNDQLQFGIRVIVPFGKSKLLTGIVTEIHERVPEAYQAKFIEHVLDEFPIVTTKQFQFWKWISSYYMAPLGDVMNASLPANFKLSSESKVVLHPDFENDQQLDEREQIIVDSLHANDQMDLKELSAVLGIKTIQPVIKKMIEKRIILSIEALNERFTPKSIVCYTLTDTFTDNELLTSFISGLESKASSRKQLEALLTVLSDGKYQGNSMQPVARKELVEKGVSLSALQTLERNGIIETQRIEVSRLHAANFELKQKKSLTPAQQKALEEVRECQKTHIVTLLHGVTGSGKTELYVELIEEQLAQGKQVLFLIPEIALTTQLIERLSAYFGEQIGVYHSKFNQNERVEIWNTVLANDPNKFRLIIGARSSVFLPYQDLGLIIVDEEHENTFKQMDPSPRYNARDAAIVLGHLHKAKVLLGTATPSIESYTNALDGKYGLVELSERYLGLQMPEIFCANIRTEKKNKSMHSHFSSQLMDGINEALNAGEQVILFQNRRGYTPMWSCEVCAWTPRCKNCDVSMTYHKHTNSLKCHYCGHISAPVGSCGACGSNRLKMVGFGTEKIEDELSLFLPNTVIKRLDLDSTRSKNAYETIIHDFENRQIHILVGTQMITKGLDFDNVGLVGILDADMLLNRPDYRAFERAFQLMVQVAGRAGRKNKKGKVIIQTSNPDQWVLGRVMEHDFKGFYETEIQERKLFFYPPYYKMIHLTLRNTDERKLNAAAQNLTDKLRLVFKERVVGPEFPLIKRIQNFFIKEIKIKIEKDASDRKVKEKIQEMIDLFYAEADNKSSRLSIDVDPY
ncbi:MAG: primosomal protein N' [Crocinitomicaceae bacterium]|nr:primosomal protein N' [Crocinitomicaceae bacterium]MCF8411201.1 primosomal protein N' [Crocinitomicaceae bacterium]